MGRAGRDAAGTRLLGTVLPPAPLAWEHYAQHVSGAVFSWTDEA